MTTARPILCESCGYDITSLEHAIDQNLNAPCPECGFRMIASRPEHRYGSPWQQRQSLTNFFKTASRVVTSPYNAWWNVRIDSRANQRLLSRSLLLASFAWPGAFLLPGVIHALFLRSNIPLALYRGVLWLFLAGAALLILHTLCYIESLGLRFFARRRHWRTDRHIALAVIAHASFGWWLGPILALVLMLIATSIGPLVRSSGAPVIPLPLAALLILIHIFLPLLAFEFLVYLGFRALRFANYPRAARAPQPPPAPPLPSPP